MAPVSAGKTAGGPASKARLTNPAFTPLKPSSAAVSQSRLHGVGTLLHDGFPLKPLS